jgi:hypothetical protein
MDLQFLEENEKPDEEYGEEIEETVNNRRQLCIKYYEQNGPNTEKLLYNDTEEDNGLSMTVSQLFMGFIPIGSYLMANIDRDYDKLMKKSSLQMMKLRRS